MKNKADYDVTFRLSRISHVINPISAEDPLRIDAISAEPNTPGRCEVLRCTREIYQQVLGDTSLDGRKIRPLLRGEQGSLILARAKRGEDGVPVVVGVDLIPLRYFAGKSGPVEALEAREKGFDIHWRDEYNGFKVDIAELGMTQRMLERLLDEIRRDMPASKRKYKAEEGYDVVKVDEVTLRVKNLSAFTKPSF